jgi:glycosyltransferase involved in cell wall biosynthesis
LPEVLGPDGECARLVRPGDAAELIKVLSELLASPEQLHRLGVAGRRRAVEVYSWESVAAQTARVYERAIDRRLPVQDSVQTVGEPC